VFSYAGKILHVDLTSRRLRKENLPEKLCKEFIGARGINVKLWWDLVKKPNIDPLSPENPLIFGTGPLTCTTAPSSGRLTVTCKSPITNLYVKTNGGGHWGAELKFAGYDYLVIHGESERPVYLFIDDDDVDLRDAAHLWGKDVRETNEILKRDLGDPEIKVACIGPGGENLVRFANILFSVYNSASRGGTGAVMGSKRLKAIATSGSGEITVKDPERFYEKALAMRKAFWNDRWGLKYWVFGTGGFGVGDTDTANNYTLLGYPGAGLVSGQWMQRKGYFKRRHGCFGCTQSCHRYVELDKGPYAGTYTCGPEAGTVHYLGPVLGIIDFETIVKAHDILDMMGLDGFSTGAGIAWAMECYERGLLTKEDTGGLELNFGNEEAALELIRMIARREGRIGELLADGVKRAAERLGKESYKWAIVNSKGLSGHEVRFLGTLPITPYAFAYAVNPRGPDHLHTEPFPSLGYTPQQVEWTEKVTGKKWPSWSYKDQEYVPEIVICLEYIYAVTDSLGLCAFTSTSALAANQANMAELFSLATGFDIDEDKITTAGERIMNMEKCFNVREGADRSMDDLPWRFMNEPLEGIVCSREWLDPLLDKYYVLHGWDIKTSWPYEETLIKLCLSDVADEMKRLGKLSKKT
jgi:aldehyde:ferredoxin oxidoreductase